jgi:RNA polymerase sigma factor (sigma-70 family)
MQRLIYFEFYSEEIVSDWRILAMNYLEKYLICESYQNRIYGYEPDDLAQELRILLWNKLDTWQGRSNLRTWANKVMKNRLKNIARAVTKTQKRKDYLCSPLEE